MRHSAATLTWPLLTVILVPTEILLAQKNKFPCFQGSQGGCFTNTHQTDTDFILPTRLWTS